MKNCRTKKYFFERRRTVTRIERRCFGHLATGEEVGLYTLTNQSGAFVEIIELGGAIRSIVVPDKNGRLTDVALGYDSVEDYEKQGKYVGALIGRHGNRLEDAKVRIKKRVYHLAKNDGRNNLHGGNQGFDKKLWRSEIDGEKLRLYYTSPDMEEGFPGTLEVCVTYSFTDDNALVIDYKAKSDADTVCNLTNHCYFNLEGQGSGKIIWHSLKINASHFTVGNSECLPTGYVAKVEGTPLDFTSFKTIADRIYDKHEQLVFAGGYDHNYCPDGSGFREMAVLKALKSGIVMKVYSDLPGIQFYSGNSLDGKPPYGKGGVPIEKRTGLCLETQFYPNAMKYDNFEKPYLAAGEEYRHITVYSFGVEQPYER